MGDDAVKVVVRCRPMNSREVSDSRVSVVDVNVPLNQVTLRNPNNDAISAEPKSFTFDAVYDEASTQRAVYDETAYPLVEAVLSGYNGEGMSHGSHCTPTTLHQPTPSGTDLTTPCFHPLCRHYLRLRSDGLR